MSSKKILTKNRLEKIRKDFLSESMNEEEVIETIRNIYNKYKVILEGVTDNGSLIYKEFDLEQ